MWKRAAAKPELAGWSDKIAGLGVFEDLSAIALAYVPGLDAISGSRISGSRRSVSVSAAKRSPSGTTCSAGRTCGSLLAVVGEAGVDDDVVEVGAGSAVEDAAAGDQA